MPVPFSGDILNAAPVVPSLAGELNTQARSEPSVGQVASAYISDIYQGNGSLQQDLSRNDFNNALDTQNSITPDEWKNSPNYRDGLVYFPGMTDKSAEILAQSHDDTKAREYVMGKASGFQTAAGFGAALGTGIFEPKNIASGVAAGILTEGLGEFVPAFKRVLAIGGELGRYKALAARGATEGALAVALTEPSNRESAKIMQKDYTMADTLLNFTMSTVLSGAGAALHAKYKDYKIAKNEKFATPSEVPEIKAKEFDATLNQMAEGRQVDIEHIQELEKGQVAIKAQNDLPKIEEKIVNTQAETGIRPVTERPEFRSWFGESKVIDENGVPQVVYHGTAADIHQFSPEHIESTKIDGIEGFYFAKNPDEASAYAQRFNQAGGNVMPVYAQIERPAPSLNEFKLDKSNKYDGFIDDKTVVVKKPEQIKSIFNRGAFDKNDPRLHDVQTLEQLQVKKGQAEVNSIADANKEPIVRNLNDTAKPDNSTAYDLKETAKINDFLGEYGKQDDAAALEQSLSFMQEDIQSMKEEGLLTGEQLAALDRLKEIDGEIDMHDNILKSAYLCLTRGQ